MVELEQKGKKKTHNIPHCFLFILFFSIATVHTKLNKDMACQCDKARTWCVESMGGGTIDCGTSDEIDTLCVEWQAEFRFTLCIM